MAGDFPPSSASGQAQQQQQQQATIRKTATTMTPLQLPVTSTFTSSSSAAAAASGLPPPAPPPPASPLRQPPPENNTNAGTPAAFATTTTTIPFVGPARHRSSLSAGGGGGGGAICDDVVIPLVAPSLTFQRSKSVGAGLGLTEAITATNETSTTRAPMVVTTPRRENSKESISSRWRRRVVPVLPRRGRWAPGNKSSSSAQNSKEGGGGGDRDGSGSGSQYGSILNDDDEEDATESGRSHRRGHTFDAQGGGAPLLGNAPRISNAKLRGEEEEEYDDDEFGLFVSDGQEEDGERMNEEHRRQQQRRSSSQSLITIRRKNTLGGGRRSSSSRSRPDEEDEHTSSLPVAASSSLQQVMDIEQSTAALVQRFEGILRILWIISGAFILGSYFPHYSHYAAKLAEYSIVAWVTCIVILLVARVQNHRPAQPLIDNDSIRERSSNVQAAAEATPLLYQQEQHQLRRQRSTPSSRRTLEPRPLIQQHVVNKGDSIPLLPHGDGGGLDDDDYGFDEIPPRCVNEEYVQHLREYDGDDQDLEDAVAAARAEMPIRRTADSTMTTTTATPTPPVLDTLAMSAAETARRRGGVGARQVTRKRANTVGGNVSVLPPLLPPYPPTMVTTNTPLLPAAHKSDNNINKGSMPKQTMTHPSLDPYFIIEHSTGRRVYPNDPHRMLFPMDTDYFTGHMMVFIRTPDADEQQPSGSKGAMTGGGQGAAAIASSSGHSLSSLENAPGAGAQQSTTCRNCTAIDYLADKQRRFEFQWQVRLKKVPTDRVFFSCELEKPVKMGIVQRAFVGAAMAFVKSTNNSFHYSISGSSSNSNNSSSNKDGSSIVEQGGGSRYTNGGSGDSQDCTTDGRYEKPHMAFPVEEGMNRIVATPPGQPVPQLGEEIEESAESIKRRKKGGRIEWNLHDTYTFSLWSAYCDFLEWRCQNLPGIRPFSLNSVIGAQSINLVLYEIPEENEKHMRCDMKIIAEFEMSNVEKSSVGRMAKQWQLEYGLQDNLLYDHHAEQQLEHHYQRQDDSGNQSGSYVDAMMEQDLDVSHADSVEGEEVEEEMELGDLDDQTTEEEAAAELGAGIYVQSGDKISLRESNFSRDQNALEDDIAPCFVTTGGGFAVLQEQSSSAIIIEKRGRRRSQSASSKLIKSGDTVSFKLVIKGRKGEEETRYLSIHRRGWYLSWVSTFSKNGYFTIHTHETEFSDHGTLDPQSSETQSSFLSFGGSFWLRSRRWSKFSVGVAAEGSAAYGGRMLGLYKAKETSPPFGAPEDYLLSDDGEERLDVEQGKAWMKPLQLRAYEVPVAPAVSSAPVNVQSLTANEEKRDEPKGNSGQQPQRKLRFSADDYQADAPVWVEIMNRTERTRQLAYVVRIVPHDNLEYDYATSAESLHSGSFVRLRTGQELAEVVRIGLSWRNSFRSPRKRKATSEQDFMTPENKQSAGIAASVSAGARIMPVDSTIVNISDHGGSFENEDGSESPDGSSSDEAASDGELVDVTDMADVDDEDAIGAVSDTPIMVTKSPRKGRKLIGKIAKTVKTKTTSTAKSTGNVTKAVASSTGKAVTSTGKAVVRQTVKVGKGTMAIIPIRTKNPPVKEPNQKTQRRAIRRTERDLHVPVRSMRRLDRYNSNLDSPSVMAGELSAPEQSCRTVSNLLLRMSTLPRSSSLSAQFNSLLSTQMENESVLDQWFLQGGAIKLGVVPNKENGELLCEAVVARCLWESHFREEWCGLYGQVVVFYASLTNTPCLELALLDIERVRVLETSSRSPLPGYGILVLETAWLCHYIAFRTDETLQNFKNKVEAAIKRLDESEDIAPTLRTKNLRSARFWQGFRSSIKSSSSQGKGKWADVASGPKTKPRIIFNNRRMVFDLFPTLGTETSFVEDLLSMALSFSFDSLLEDPQILVKFLDAASQLRNISIHSMNFESHEAFCLFVNLYHCLLQHAMLLTVSGPLTKRSCVDFMRTTCYEIGGDVFSLAELQCCVIRGRTSRPSPAKPPYIDTSRKSGAFRYYSLGFTSPRVNFLINSGDTSCPRTVMILHPDALDEQLTKAAQDFVNRNVAIDESKRIIYIPKVCEVYRSDFVPDSAVVSAPMACLRYCMGFMNEDLATKVQDMLSRGDATVKYQSTAEQYHSALRMKMIEMI